MIIRLIPADLVAIDLIGKDRRFKFAEISCRKFNRRSQFEKNDMRRGPDVSIE
jgi:hypothetical protein